METGSNNATFTVGATYMTRSICNYDTIVTATVTKRTKHFVTFDTAHDKNIKRKIRTSRYGEGVPLFAGFWLSAEKQLPTWERDSTDY